MGGEDLWHRQESGKKRQTGLLHSQSTRQGSLSDRSHRIRFLYLSKHTSWLNQIEIVFGVVSRKVIREVASPR